MAAMESLRIAKFGLSATRSGRKRIRTRAFLAGMA